MSTSNTKYNSLELAERENKSSTSNNQIEILDGHSASTNYHSEINSTSTIENIETNIEQDTYRLDLLNNKLFNRDYDIKNPVKIGNKFAFVYFRGDPLITIGPHYPLGLCLISGLTAIYIAMNSMVYSKISPNYDLIALIIWIFQIISHLMTALMNPGVPSRKNFLPEYIKANKIDLNKKNPDLQICRLCNIIVHKDYDVSHCEECDVCIKGHDHHCPWTSKCIGKYNLIPFYIFVFSTLVFIIFNFISILMYGILMTERQQHANTNPKLLG